MTCAWKSLRRLSLLTISLTQLDLVSGQVSLTNRQTDRKASSKFAKRGLLPETLPATQLQIVSPNPVFQRVSEKSPFVHDRTFTSNFEALAKFDDFRAFGGMALIMIGGVLAIIGSHGLAETGIVLDPEKARQDVGPWSRMSGETVQDALSEVELRRCNRPSSLTYASLRHPARESLSP